jgi:hypothetical protein
MIQFLEYLTFLTFGMTLREKETITYPTLYHTSHYSLLMLNGSSSPYYELLYKILMGWRCVPSGRATA